MCQVVELARALGKIEFAMPRLASNVVHVGCLIKAQRLITLGDDAGTTNEGVVDHHGVGQHKNAEVGAVICASHGVESRGDIVDGVAGGQLGAAQRQEELLQLN